MQVKMAVKVICKYRVYFFIFSYTCSECRSPGAPGGHVCLNSTMLYYIVAVHQKLGYIHVSLVVSFSLTLYTYILSIKDLAIFRQVKSIVFPVHFSYTIFL
jgi:hypothetical protein